jgi:hypothetical protein
LGQVVSMEQTSEYFTQPTQQSATATAQATYSAW